MMPKKNEIRKKNTIQYVFISLACIIGALFSWGSVIYALEQNPVVKVFKGRLPHIENAEAKQNVKKNKASAEIAQRKLDGRLVATKDANHFPVAVMIENLITIRPQSGLSQAQVVYESLVEGGITRFMAIYDVFAEEVGQIGPVRSARPYYLEWLGEYDALYVHAGGSPEALQNISAFNINDLNQIRGSAQYFWRNTSTSAPHNLYTSTELLRRALRDTKLAEKEPSFESWNFQDVQHVKSTEQGENNNEQEHSLTIHYSSGKAYEVEWKYEKENEEYTRFNANIPHLDRNTHQQIRAKNVIVAIIPPIVSIGEKGRLTLDVIGEGKVAVARSGEIIEGKWKKENRTARMEFLTSNGEKIDLRPGATWIQIVPSDREVVYK